MANTNGKKVVAYVIIAVLLIGGGYFVYSYFSDKAAVKPGVAQKLPPNVPPAKQANNTETGFPLKSGSRNDYVKQLQAALGVTTDGIFGPITLAALQAQANTSAIASYNQLQTIIASISSSNTSASAVAQRESQAADLITAGQSVTNGNPNGYTNIQVIADGVWHEADKVNQGYYDQSDGFINVTSGMKFNLSDYSLAETDQFGNLVIWCNKGGNMGNWLVDPAAIQFV